MMSITTSHSRPPKSQDQVLLKAIGHGRLWSTPPFRGAIGRKRAMILMESDAHVSGGHAVLVGALHDQEPTHQKVQHHTHKTI